MSTYMLKCATVIRLLNEEKKTSCLRSRSPYKWKPGTNVLKKNSVRLAEVWLDEFKQIYYERINNNLGDFGNVSSRIELRTQLQCKK